MAGEWKKKMLRHYFLEEAVTLQAVAGEAAGGDSSQLQEPRCALEL